MQIEELLEKAKESLDVNRVYGEPIERNGVTVIPVARISGGGGSGSGPVAMGSGGTGYGFKAEPAGVYVIKNGNAVWRPAVNVNRIVTGSFVVGSIAILMTPRIMKRAKKLFG